MSNLNSQGLITNFVLRRKNGKWICALKTTVGIDALEKYHNLCDKYEWETDELKIGQFKNGKIRFLDDTEIWSLR